METYHNSIHREWYVSPLASAGPISNKIWMREIGPCVKVSGPVHTYLLLKPIQGKYWSLHLQFAMMGSNQGLAEEVSASRIKSACDNSSAEPFRYHLKQY